MIKFYDENGQAHFGQATIKRTQGVNGSLSLSGVIFDGEEALTKLDRGWWLNFDNEKYVVTYKKLNDVDRTVEFDAIQEFFWDFSKTALHEQLNGSHEFEVYLNKLFDNSGYKFNLDVQVAAFEKENWGYKNKLDLFNDVIQQAGVEFEVHNEIVHITKQVGDDLTSFARKGINLSDLTEEMKISDFVTYGKGYGAFKDENDHNKGRLEVEYESELSKKYGRLELDPIVDERYKIADNLVAAIKEKVDASYSISVTMNIHDLETAGYPKYQSPQIGDWLLAIDEALNFKRRIRIIKLEEDFDATGKRVGYVATCGDLSAAEQYQNSQSDINNRIDDIANQVDDVATSADGKNSNYYGDTEPSNPNEGDLWFDTSSSDPNDWIIYQWHNGRWEKITPSQNEIADEVNDQLSGIQDAIDDAQKAVDIANGKIDDFNNSLNIIHNDINQAKSDAANALNNITVIDSKLTQLSDDTTARFNTLSNGYQFVLDTVNNMEIGGRNLVLNSNDMSKFRVWQADGSYKLSEDNKEITVTSSHGGINIERKSLSGVLPNNGDVVVISADVKGTSHLQFNYNDGDKFVGSGTNIPVTTEYKRYYTTFDWKPVNVDKTNFVIYTVGAKDQYLTIKNIKIEIGNKATDWSPAPEDFAKETEITVMQGLIDQKVSTDQYNSDKTQTDNLINQTVSKVNGINTQINQVADDIQLISTTGAQKNLVYNSSYSNNAEGWNMFNKTGYLSTLAVSSYNGSPGFGINVSGKNATTWTQFGQTKLYQLPQPDAVAAENTYSASAVIKIYSDSDKGAQLSATVAYFDKNGKRLTWKDMKVDYSSKDVWKKVKFEDFKVPKGAYSISMQFWGYGSHVHGMIVEPMIVFGPKVVMYQSDNVSSAQLDVSINGIQTNVNNQVNGLKTQITQTSDAIQLLAGTVGSRNLVYNATYEQLTGGFPTGWLKDSNGKAYFSTNQVSSYQGRGSIGVLTDANSLGWIDVARSQPMKLAVDNNPDANYNVYSASAMIKCYNDAGKGNGRVLVNLAAYDNNNTRLEPYMQVWSKRAKETNSTWELVKVEGFQPPKGATRIAISFWVYGDQTHAMINQPMINLGKKAEPFKPDSANQASITESINNINLKVSNADGSSSQVNINNNTILLDANKIVLNGNVSIKDGTIGTAKISSLSADKITAGTLNASKVNVVNINAANITTGTVKGASLSINLNNGQVVFQHGRIHSTSNNVDINIDNGYLSVANSNNRVMLKNGEMQFVSPNYFDVSNDPYFSITNGGSGLAYTGARMVGREYVVVSHKTNADNVFDLPFGKESFAGLSVGYSGGYNPTKIGGADRGVIISGGGQMSSNVDLFSNSPNILVGVDAQSSFNHNRIMLNGQYVHAMSTHVHSSSGSANVIVAADGALVSTKSASKYKLNINKLTDREQAHALLSINAKTWYDKFETESIAKTMTEGHDENSFGNPKLKPYLGFIAEDFANAGLEMLVTRDKNGELESINYDRISALEHLNVQELFSRVLQLEKEVYELRSEKNGS